MLVDDKPLNNTIDLPGLSEPPKVETHVTPGTAPAQALQPETVADPALDVIRQALDTAPPPPDMAQSTDVFFEQLHTMLVPIAGESLDENAADTVMGEWTRAAIAALTRMPAQAAALEADFLILESQARLSRLRMPRTGTSLEALLRMAGDLDKADGNGTDVNTAQAVDASEPTDPSFVNRDGTINQL